jgi:hypothetical protein
MPTAAMVGGSTLDICPNYKRKKLAFKTASTAPPFTAPCNGGEPQDPRSTTATGASRPGGKNQEAVGFRQCKRVQPTDDRINRVWAEHYAGEGQPLLRHHGAPPRCAGRRRSRPPPPLRRGRNVAQCQRIYILVQAYFIYQHFS